MKTLYFDINGTLVHESGHRGKSALAHGVFEDAVRAAGFRRLVCVSSLVRVVQTMRAAGRVDDPWDALFAACGGAFTDHEWFRRIVELGEHCHQRVRCIELDGDWWYLDDAARLYCEDAGRDDLYRLHVGGRIFDPDPVGDGTDVLEWLRTTRQPREPD